MNIPGFFAGLTISSRSDMITFGKSYESGIRKNNVVVLQQQPTNNGTGEENCNVKEKPCCSKATKSCRCESPSACYRMGDVCRDKGYDIEIETPTTVVCTAPFTQSTGGIHGPLTGSVISRL
jgi:hypothetical protein